MNWVQSPGKWLSHHPWKYWQDMKMWPLGTWLSGLCTIRLMVGFNVLKGLLQPTWFYDSDNIIPCLLTGKKQAYTYSAAEYINTHSTIWILTDNEQQEVAFNFLQLHTFMFPLFSRKKNQLINLLCVCLLDSYFADLEGWHTVILYV